MNSNQTAETKYDYDKSGHVYSTVRKTDPRIEKQIHLALGSAKTLINVGAGAGSYEPLDKYVVAIEPSAVMRAQRVNKVPAINASADSLPFDDNSFDAAMAMITIHHWPDIKKGLVELSRVTKGNVVVLTCDPHALGSFWNSDYFSELIEIERKRFPTVEFIKDCFNNECEVQTVPVPLDCEDGFIEAFYGRPEELLKKEVRAAQSSWKFLPQGKEDELADRLRKDLESGKWDEKFGHFRSQPQLMGSMCLIVGKKGNSEI